MPMRLDDGWNQIQFNLSDFTRRAYGTNYIETLRIQVSARRQARDQLSPTSVTSEFLQWMSKTVFLSSSQIHANCRIRRVYFSDRLYSEDELPAEFKLYLPVQNQKAKVKHTPPHTNNPAFAWSSLHITIHSYTYLFVWLFLAAVEIVHLHSSPGLMWSLAVRFPVCRHVTNFKTL